MKKHIKSIFLNIEEIICCSALVITIMSVLINTISGWVTGKRYGELIEIALIGFVWVIFMGLGIVNKYSNHIRIDFIIDALPKGIRKIIIPIVEVLCIVFCLYIAYYASILTMGAVNKTTSLLRISYFYIDLAVVLGFISLAFHNILDLIKSLRLAGKETN